MKPTPPSGQKTNTASSSQSEMTVQQALELATKHHSAGNLSTAQKIYRKILKANPNHSIALQFLGVISHQMGQNTMAEKLIRQALAINPRLAGAHNNLGVVLQSGGKLEDALENFQQSISLNPNEADPFNNMGTALHRLKRWDEALESFQQALSINPSFAAAHNNLGLLLKEMGNYTAAISSYENAIAAKPNFADAHNNLGGALHQLKKVGAAIERYKAAISFQSNHSTAHKNLGLLLLLTGDYRNGWEHYAWRWQDIDSGLRPRTYEKPRWEGEILEGEYVFLYPDQGLGDFFQFVRYVPLVAAKGAKVLLETPEAIAPLVSEMGIADQVFATGEIPSSFDFHAPLLDLPKLFGTTLKNIPSDVPYIQCAKKSREKWKKRLGKRKQFRVGIVWSSNPKNVNLRHKSVELPLFAPLVEISGVTTYSLQVGRKNEVVSYFGDKVIDLGPELIDFSDTAALVDQLDLVVSVDTSVAHLAGALGRPIWTLIPFLPDWRWQLEGENSPWYPTMRLFRQFERNNWKPAMDQVTNELRKTLARH